MGGAYAGNDGYREHYGDSNGCEPVPPRCSLYVCHFYNDGTDGERLEEHFQLSREYCCEADASGLSDVAEDGNVDFAQNQDGGDGPENDCVGSAGEAEQLRLAYYCKADESSAHEDFVCDGVDHSAELACYFQLSCYRSVDDVGEAGDHEEDERDVEEERLIFDSAGEEEHCEENDGEYEPAKGQNVRNLFEHICEFTYLVL